jgi:hypothetical protein
MSFSIEGLDAPSRRTVEAFMDCYLERDAEGLKDLLAENASFEGAFSGGMLKGCQVITAHYRQSFRGIFSKGVVRFHGGEVEDRQVVLNWELDCPGEGSHQTVQGLSTLVLDQSGRIQTIKAVWDPKALLGWKNPS